MTQPAPRRPALRTLRPALCLLMGLGSAAAFLAPQPRAEPPPQASEPSSTLEAVPESPVVVQLEVVGRRPGPALWRVRRGDAEVIILGGLSPLPHLLQWDQIRVERALSRATLLLLPPSSVHVGLLDAASLVLRQGALKAGPGGMEAGLAPEVKARFDRLAASFHADPKRYREWKPAIAGILLLGDFYRAAGLSQEKPGTTVAKLAKANNVEVRTAGALRFKPLFEAAARMTPQQNAACLSAELDELEWEAAHARPAAEAWAVGDLKGVRSNVRSVLLDQCVSALPSLNAAIDQGVDEGVQTIEDALKRPTTTLAVVDLTLLLRKGGVLDRLKAKGDEISVPGD